MKDKRTVLQEMLQANPHSPPSADAILNALHQAGWKVVPKNDLAGLLRGVMEVADLPSCQRREVARALTDYEGGVADERLYRDRLGYPSDREYERG